MYITYKFKNLKHERNFADVESVRNKPEWEENVGLIFSKIKKSAFILKFGHLEINNVGVIVDYSKGTTKKNVFLERFLSERRMKE